MSFNILALITSGWDQLGNMPRVAALLDGLLYVPAAGGLAAAEGGDGEPGKHTVVRRLTGRHGLLQ